MGPRDDRPLRTGADLVAAFRDLEQRASDPRRVLTAIRAATSAGADGGRRGGATGRYPARRWRMAGTAVLAAAVTAAMAIAVPALLSAASRSSALGNGHHQLTPASSLPVLHSARQVLLMAAADVPAEATTGSYWHIAEVQGDVLAGGTKAHPYNIVTRNPAQTWYARTPGHHDWMLSDLNMSPTQAIPATSADWAAWRASGSPPGWFPLPGRHRDSGYRYTVRAQPLQYVWQASDGVVGWIFGVDPGFHADQFARMPASYTALRRYLFSIADRLAKPPINYGIPASSIVWVEAKYLLVDPVSADVRAATFRVMASLPGVRLLGLVTDPLGRQGYGLAMKFDESELIINPVTGTLLDNVYGVGRPEKPNPAGPQQQPPLVGCGPHATPGRRAFCKLETYYGRPDTWTGYVAFTSVGWVAALPKVPPAVRSNQGYVGAPL